MTFPSLFHSTRRFGLLVLATGMMTWAIPASAEAVVDLVAFGGSLDNMASFHDHREIEISGSIAYGGSFATGFANLDTGILRSSAVSDVGTFSSTTALSKFGDAFRFSDGASGTAYLDWSIDGTASAVAGLKDSYGFGTLEFSLRTPGISVPEPLTYYYASSDFVCQRLQGKAPCSVGSSFAASGSIPVPITSGDYSLGFSLAALAWQGGTANFGNTARLYLRTPNGVTIESGSGTFLASATPITVVPEPSTNALLLAGLGLVTWSARRYRLS